MVLIWAWMSQESNLSPVLWFILTNLPFSLPYDDHMYMIKRPPPYNPPPGWHRKGFTAKGGIRRLWKGSNTYKLNHRPPHKCKLADGKRKIDWLQKQKSTNQYKIRKLVSWVLYHLYDLILSHVSMEDAFTLASFNNQSLPDTPEVCFTPLIT